MDKIFTKILVLSLAVISISSCMKNDLKKYYGRPGTFTMQPPYMGQMPNGDDSYSQGMRDGCNTSVPILGAGPMASMYESSYYDPNRAVEDKDYAKGFDLGFNYCSYYQDVDPL